MPQIKIATPKGYDANFYNLKTSNIDHYKRSVTLVFSFYKDEDHAGDEEAELMTKTLIMNQSDLPAGIGGGIETMTEEIYEAAEKHPEFNA